MLSRDHFQGSIGTYCPTRLFHEGKPPFVSDIDAKTCPVCAAWNMAESLSGKTISLPKLSLKNLKCEPIHAIDFLLHGKTVLAVEDNPVSMKLLTKTLTPFEKQVVKAGNGIEAMKVIEEKGDVGLVLLDMDMPEMNGSEFIDEVLKCFDCLPFAVVLVSELTNWNEAKRLIDKGVLSSVKKPYKKDEFYETILNSLLIFGNGLPLK